MMVFASQYCSLIVFFMNILKDIQPVIKAKVFPHSLLMKADEESINFSYLIIAVYRFLWGFCWCLRSL